MGIKAHLKKLFPAVIWGILSKMKSGVLDYWLFINLKYLINLKYRNYNPKIYLSVAAIVKNEGQYIAEWIEYHLLVGVNKFYIYDNESEDNLKEVLAPYIQTGIVEYSYYPGRGAQYSAYNAVLKKARKETYWLAFIDCDEFIVPVSTAKISSLLKEFEGYGGLGINWMMYGSGGRQTKTEGLVIERFKNHAEKTFDVNRHIKTIANPRYVCQMHIHHAVYIHGKYCVNTNKELIKDVLSDVVFDKIRINHYFTKSYAEFLLKRERRRADTDEKRSMQDFYAHDRNEEKNDAIMDKYIPVIYKNIYERYKKLRPNSAGQMADSK
jgi:hypothetical protein